MLIASKLDKDIAAKQCRLSFYGQVLSICQEPSPNATIDKIKVVKEKTRTGKVDRVTDARNLIVKELFNKETTQELFMNKPVKVKIEETGESIEGVINGTFGKSGKQKVQLKEEYKGTGNIEKAEVELKIKVFSKELSKMRNIK